MRLGRIERNQLLELIVRAGMEPHEFELRSVENDGTLVAHLSTDSTFRIGDQYVNEVPGGLISLGRRIGERSPERLDAPNYQMPFVDWLQQVKAEAAAPDLWADLERDRAILHAAAQGNTDDAPFTSEEKRQVL
ncbi:MAG: hypothetical protein ACYDHT_01415, partial [Solirubrobacteraceae bacterium]